MTHSSNLRDQAYQFFVEEAPELLQIIESGLLSLRQGRDTTQIHEMMRAAHSLKGGAASVGLEAIKALAHRLETLFKALYSDRLVLDRDLENQLLQAFDCLRLPLMAQLHQGYYDPEQALATAEPILSALEVQFEAAIAETENFIPGSADFGFNMAASIFEIDVAQGLDHWAAVLAEPDRYEVIGELRAQAEVFIGFAELLNLPGFAAIAQTTLQALEAHPDRVLAIGALALEDFHEGRSAVLAGDTLQGGNPSDGLLALSSRATDWDATELAAADLALAELAAENAPDPDWETDEWDTAAWDRDELAGAEGDIFTELAETYRLIASAEAASFAFGAETAGETDADPVFGYEVDREIYLDDIDDDIETHLGAIVDDFGDSDALDDPNDIEDLDDLYDIDDSYDLNDLNAAYHLDHHTDLESLYSTYIYDWDAELANDDDEEAADDEEEDEKTVLIPPNLASSHLEEILTDFGLPPASRTEAARRIASRSAAPKLEDGRSQWLLPSQTVRVDTDRLARMDNLLGELTINRNGLALQTDQLRLGIRELLNRFERVRATVERLQSASEQMLIAPERRGMVATASAHGVRSLERSRSSSLDPFRQTRFDTLEMDSYSIFYTDTQTLLEEMLQLEEAVEDFSLYNRQSESLLGQHRKMLGQLQDDLMWARMVPLGEVLNRFPRILRDLSDTYGKPAELHLKGTHLLIDRAVLEKLYDPLLHLLRNGFAHGLETPEVRRAQGKPETGQITIQVSYQGRRVVLEVQDDGQGLDLTRIHQRAVELGWLPGGDAGNGPGDAGAAGEWAIADLQEFIFRPGFSTAAEVNDLSGRGIGLDVVREQLTQLKGTVAVHSIPGQGTTFTLSLPLTLSVVNLLVCFAGPAPIALRSDNITEILIPRPGQLSRTGHQQVLQWQGRSVPTYRLAEVLSYACLVPEIPPSRVLAAVPSPSDWESPVLILQRHNQFFALQVDRLVTEQESVIKPFGTALTPPSYVYGCTVLGDGRLIPVVDGRAFLETLLDDQISREWGAIAHFPGDSSDQPGAALVPNEPGQGHLPIRMSQANTVLVVDDAITSRRMLALSLERAGYRVLQARDGQEALEQLQQNPTVQLVVCDIEMPNMNGFEFLTQRRQDPALAAIPTVMLTSRSNDKHRWLATQLGANGYFTKPYLEQEFLQAIAAHIAIAPSSS